MTPCSRLEIVIEAPLAQRLAARLLELGAPGYTLIPRAHGSGDRGERRGDEPTGTSTNSLFLVICEDQALARRLVEGIEPMLRRAGGLCVLSEALYIEH